MTIAKLEILTANPETTDANLEKNFTATETTMTARVMVSVIRTMVGTEYAGVATLVHHTSTVTAGGREPMRLRLNKAKAGVTSPPRTAYDCLCGGRLGAQTVKLL